jgi:uncharacterized protein
MRARWRMAILLTAMEVVGGGAGCRNGRAGGDPGRSVAVDAPTVILHAGTNSRTVPVHVELARTDAERSRGLMFRNRLEPQEGMLFLFPEASPLSFWMKNTLIPLDMIFISADRQIVGIVENAEPGTLSSRQVDGLSKYVLEIGGGLSAKLGIQAGAAVDLSGVPDL